MEIAPYIYLNPNVLEGFPSTLSMDYVSNKLGYYIKSHTRMEIKDKVYI